MTAESTIRVVLFPEGNAWVAQALEYDIASSATTLRESIRRMIETIAHTRSYTTEQFGAPFIGIDPAPARFFAMFEQAKLEISPVGIEDELPEATAPHIAARFLEEACA